jgi:hypothetical protein
VTLSAFVVALLASLVAGLEGLLLRLANGERPLLEWVRGDVCDALETALVDA